jgi:copper chaperone CopZ
MKSVVYETFMVDNLKCGGCAATVEQELMRLDFVDFVKVDLTKGTVRVMFNNLGGESRTNVLDKLKHLGYPLKGTSTTLDEARSYVSCAIGRIHGDHRNRKESSAH